MSKYIGISPIIARETVFHAFKNTDTMPDMSKLYGDYSKAFLKTSP